MGRPTKRGRLDGNTLPPCYCYIVLLLACTKSQFRDKATTNEIPLNVASLEGELSFGVNLTARPTFTFGILAVGGAAARLDAGFALDLPKVFAKVTAVKSTSLTLHPPLIILRPRLTIS